MPARSRAIVVGALVTAIAAALHLHSLDDTPIYLGGDEAHFGVQAHAIATTGRDLRGRFLPLFVNVHGPLGPHQASTRWYQPLNFYLIAGALKILPLSEWSIRLPLVLVGILNVVLMYLVALRLFPRVSEAALAAALLVLTPAHLIFSRQALDYLLPVPFVLGWLLCLAITLERGSLRAATIGGLLLGIGMFSYLAAWVLMPCLLLLTLAVMMVSPHARLRSVLAMLAGFLLPALVLAGWLLAEPQMLEVTLARYSTPGSGQLTLLQRLRESLAYGNVQEKIGIYWENFNPAFLFFAGSSNLTVSTRQVGVFLLPVAVLLVCGIYDRWREARTAPIGLVLVGGLLASALPPTLAGERYAFQREVAALPFAVLLATYGSLRLLRAPRAAIRLVAVALLVAMPLQYAYFYRDYFGDYRLRSAYWFDPVDFRDVAEWLMREADRQPPPAIYFAESLDDVGARWGFYLVKHGRASLWERTRFYRPDIFDSDRAAPGSLLVLSAQDAATDSLAESGQWQVATIVRDAATGNAAAVILRRNG